MQQGGGRAGSPLVDRSGRETEIPTDRLIFKGNLPVNPLSQQEEESRWLTQSTTFLRSARLDAPRTLIADLFRTEKLLVRTSPLKSWKFLMSQLEINLRETLSGNGL